MKEIDLYSFVYRGILTEEALDKTGRRRRNHFGADEADQIQKSLSYDYLDAELLTEAQRMSVVYAALHAFENAVRHLVCKAMDEKYGAAWWEKVPERIRKASKNRMDEDSKFKWHGARGATEINYCDFGDLSSIVVTNWEAFEGLLGNMEWAKAVLNTLEKSRNIVMHGGSISNEDIERVGTNIRDWIRQAG